MRAEGAVGNGGIGACYIRTSRSVKNRLLMNAMNFFNKDDESTWPSQEVSISVTCIMLCIPGDAQRSGHGGNIETSIEL